MCRSLAAVARDTEHDDAVLENEYNLLESDTDAVRIDRCAKTHLQTLERFLQVMHGTTTFELTTCTVSSFIDAAAWRPILLP